jgi:hypothetical protein
MCSDDRAVFSFNAYPVKNNRKLKSGTNTAKTLLRGIWLILFI